MKDIIHEKRSWVWRKSDDDDDDNNKRVNGKAKFTKSTYEKQQNLLSIFEYSTKRGLLLSKNMLFFLFYRAKIK